jgi:signal transduction histidine kinase
MRRIGHEIAPIGIQGRPHSSKTERAIKPYRLQLTTSLFGRSTVASVHLAVLLAFLLAQTFFSVFHGAPPGPVFLLAAFGIALRIFEMSYADRSLEHHPQRVHGIAAFSILWSLLLPFLLAMATQRSDTHYFGLLTLPVLETALYFSFSTTLLVASLASSIAGFWVIYAAHFKPPFRLGELLEATTLVLVLFVVGTLVWWLVARLSDREEELQHRLEDLESTRSRLIQEEKLAAVGRLASAVAHEIRNPVAIISSALEASCSSAARDRLELSNIARMEAKRLEQLTTDFLSYAQPGSAPFVELDAAALVGYIVAIVRPQAEQKSLTIDLESNGECRIFGNEGKLQQVLINLMRNAMEASPRGTRIGVEVGRFNAKKIRIALTNEGPAIPGHVVRHLFEPFFTAKEGGTGLGLAIARSIMEKHDGELILESNESNRIVFAAILPAIAAPPAARSKMDIQWQES